MKDNSYTTTIETAQLPEHVFNSICHITKWWSNDFAGEASGLNGEFTIHHPNQHYSQQKVIEFVPNERIVWLVTESRLFWLKGDQGEWTGTKMDFGISRAGNKTILRFTHEGLTPEKECYAMCETGWNIVINNWLHHYIETGKPADEMQRAPEIRGRHFEGNG